MTEIIMTLDDNLKIIDIQQNNSKDDKCSDTYVVSNSIDIFLTLLESDDIIDELQNRYLGMPPKPVKNIKLDKYVRLRKQ